MGSGGSYDAEYTLHADVPAGAYHVVCDNIIVRAADVAFALIHRRPGADDVTLAAWQKHFDPLPGNAYDAQAYELDVDAPAIDYQSGDELVFRYTGLSSTAMMAFIPNGEGKNLGGRIPSITLPK